MGVIVGAKDSLGLTEHGGESAVATGVVGLGEVRVGSGDGSVHISFVGLSKKLKFEVLYHF